ncbi:MAG: hypothetical protein GY862_12260 [Gammaproteobacteria bacterium]|nr:hypothetical protein [Gammaproteobacteria bacterium]
MGKPESMIDFSHVLLSLNRWSDFWEKVSDVEAEHGQDVPDKLLTFTGKREDDELGYGETAESPYGGRIQCVEARYLKPLAEHLSDETGFKTRAAWAYLEQCPDDLLVGLYWS